MMYHRLPSNSQVIESMGEKFDVVSMDCARGTLPGDGHMGIDEDKRLKERLIQIGGGNREYQVLSQSLFSHVRVGARRIPGAGGKRRHDSG